MPEGHTIHRAAKDQTARLLGPVGGPARVSVTSPQGRFTEDAQLLQGKYLTSIEAWGKHLFYIFAEGPNVPSKGKRVTPLGLRPGQTVVHVHLGLFGRFRMHKNAEPRVSPDPRGAVRMRLAGDTHTIDLSGPTDCRIITDDEVQTLCERLGPDPLRPVDRPALAAAIQRMRESRRSIGALLLDQSVISGVGNIYRAEILFRLGIDPRVPGSRLTEEQLRAIWNDASELLQLGVRLNRIITVRKDDMARSPSRLRYHERTYVAHRSECLKCGGGVKRFDLGARAMFMCEACQAG